MSAGRRWRPKGANVQRPLWASTSTKNPDYSDTLYVDELIGPDTVNTMPDATIDAARDHATAARTVDVDVEEAHRVIEGVKAAGVDFDDIVGRELVDEGVKSFAASFDSLIDDHQGEGLVAVSGGAVDERRPRDAAIAPPRRAARTAARDGCDQPSRLRARRRGPGRSARPGA